MQKGLKAWCPTSSTLEDPETGLSSPFLAVNKHNKQHVEYSAQSISEFTSEQWCADLSVAQSLSLCLFWPLIYHTMYKTICILLETNRPTLRWERSNLHLHTASLPAPPPPFPTIRSFRHWTCQAASDTVEKSLQQCLDGIHGAFTCCRVLQTLRDSVLSPKKKAKVWLIYPTRIVKK